jgi:hypothetical protein
MGLQVVACPECESDVALAICALQAHGIPYLVHNGAFGALWPGPQIHAYNARRIMVPTPFAEEARQVLAEMAPPRLVDAAAAAAPRGSGPTTLRLLLEAFLLGWFVPRRDDSAR